jgi:hypothetical protein
MTGGLIAFAMAGFETKAKTAIIMGQYTHPIFNQLDQFRTTELTPPHVYSPRIFCSFILQEVVVGL